MKNLMFLFVFAFASLSLSAQSDNPIELGKIEWLRNYSEALEKAEKENKPVFILFQEVPGCATCRNYGKNVLSHGLVVDAIENEFIPLAIHNNKGGHDRDVLELFGEPTWNNPVVRIVNYKGDDLVKRIAGKYSVHGVVEGMLSALKKDKKNVPGYLELLKEESALGKKDIREAHYSMYCFWSGEGHLGAQEGVVATSPGFMDGREVVKVFYDVDKVSKKKLDTYASKAKCTAVDKSSFRMDKDPQYYLKNSIYSQLPLTTMQRTKVNSALIGNKDPEYFLSPSQLEWVKDLKAKKIKAKKKLYTEEFDASWWAFSDEIADK